MKTLLNPWFLAGCIIWLVVITTRKLSYPIPWLNGYIDDAASIPVIANLGLWFQRVFIYRNNYYVLALGHVVFIVIYISLIFEVVLPLLSKKYTADWIDVLLYVIGGVFFFRVVNKPLVA